MVLPVGEHAAAAFRIVAVERFHDTSFVAGSGIGACGLPAAGAGLRHHVLILSTVQVLLHMGDDHVAFAAGAASVPVHGEQGSKCFPLPAPVICFRNIAAAVVCAFSFKYSSTNSWATSEKVCQ